MEHEHAKFLKMFGRARAAAGAFEVAEQQIRHWKLRGIPARYWHKAEEIAKARGWDVTAATLAASAPAGKTARAA